MSKTITLITGSADKMKEFVDLFGQTSIKVSVILHMLLFHSINSWSSFKIVAKKIDLPEYQGEPDDISKLKCKAAAEIIGGPVIVDDTCLCFHALGGLPGPYIKWFLEKIGPDGLNKLLHAWDDKSATAVCTIAYCDGPNHDVLLFKGEAQGKIVEPRGLNGFGWDLCFQPNGYDKTYAELGDQIKNRISHRFLACDLFRKHFSSQ